MMALEMTDAKTEDGLAKLEFPEMTVAGGRRPPHQSRWKSSDLLVLIAAKKFEFERLSSYKSRDKTKSAGLRWKEVEGFCRLNGVNRKAGQCRKRWEKLMTDFKKVYDYQKKIPEGQPGYFEMSSEEWKMRKLPLNFLLEWYRAMEAWIPNQRSSHPDPNQIMDSTAGENFPTQNGEPGTPSASPFALHLDEEDITDAGDGSPEGDERIDLGGEDEDGSSQGEEQLGNDVKNINHIGAGPSLSDARGWKRARVEKSDDPFVKLAGKFLEAVTADSVKRNLFETEYLALEKQKYAAELQKHALKQQQQSEQLTQSNKISSDISNALKEVSASLRFFATEIAKKL
ncbi:unnamed protein product [Calypogeia fissa]